MYSVSLLISFLRNLPQTGLNDVTCIIIDVSNATQ